MVKITKKKNVKISVDELYDLCHSFYKEGSIDHSQGADNDVNMAHEFQRFISKVKK